MYYEESSYQHELDGNKTFSWLCLIHKLAIAYFIPSLSTSKFTRPYDPVFPLILHKGWNCSVRHYRTFVVQ